MILDAYYGRMRAWVEARPSWLRPIAAGPLLILLFMDRRGAFLFGPVAIVVLLVRSATPLRDLGLLALGLLGVLGLGALSGLVYSLVGRRVRAVPFLGPYFAGMVTVVPYAFGLVLLGRASDQKAILVPLDSAERVALLLMVLLFGSVIGFVMLRAAATTVHVQGEVASTRNGA